MSFDDFVDFGEDELEDLKGSVSFWRAPIHLALLKAGIYTPQARQYSYFTLTSNVGARIRCSGSVHLGAWWGTEPGPPTVLLYP